MPRVIDPSTKIIFCEGDANSLDPLFLRHLVPGEKAYIETVGSKYTLRAFIEGYLANYNTSQPSYIGFRDRDFDFEPTDIPQLIRLPGEKPIWLTHRATIENYFVDADLLRQYWMERENTPAWKHGPAPSIDEFENHIRDSASELVDYQAVRWGLAKLKPGSRWPEIETRWTKASGTPTIAGLS